MSCEMHSHYLKDQLVQFWGSGKACSHNLWALGALILMVRLEVLWEDGASWVSWWRCPQAKQQRNPQPIYPSLKHLLRSCFVHQKLKQSCAVFQLLHVKLQTHAKSILWEIQMFHSSKDLWGIKGSWPAHRTLSSHPVFLGFSSDYTWAKDLRLLYLGERARMGEKIFM